MAEKTLIFDRALTANALNYSDFFSKADFLYVTSSSGEWSLTGDFVEVDIDLLVTVEPGVKRRIPLALNYASTRELIRLPEEFSRTEFLMELVIQASFSENLKIWAVSVSTSEDVEAEFERIRALINLILFLIGGPALPSLPGAPNPDFLPGLDWLPALPGVGP